MKFLRSIWGLAILALLVSFGTSGVLLYTQLGSLIDPSAPAVKVTNKTWSFNAKEVDALVEELNANRLKAEAREQSLEKLQTQLQVERQELDKVRADVQAIRDDISKNLVEIQEAEVKNLKNLAQTYSNLTPAGAVSIFKEMNDASVVKILAFMKSDKVGPILQEMAKTLDKDENMAKRAALISDKLRLLKPQKKENI